MEMRQVRCVRPFGHCDVGDVVEVPEGALVDPEHWEDAPPVVTVDDTAAAAAIASAKEAIAGLAAKVASPAKEA